MAEPSPQATSSETVYQPLSALAVAGFLVSCVFGGIVLISAVIAFLQGAPFFFETWVLLVAVLGFVLSYAGNNDIHNSEGTKAGARLASWGMGLSVVCGLGYFAYSYFTGLALAQQATSFFMTYGDDTGVLPRLQKAGQDKVEFHRSFLLTLPASDRGGVKAEDEATMTRVHDQFSADGMPSKLERFRSNEFVRAIMLGGPDATIEPLGVQEWKYESRSYQVRRLYRIRTPELVMTVGLTAKSAEGDVEGQARTWFFDIGNVQRQQWDLTALGQGLRNLRSHAKMVVSKWHDKLREGEPYPDFVKVDATNWDKIHSSATVRNQMKTRILAGMAGEEKQWFIKPFQEVGFWDWQRGGDGRLTVWVPLFLAFPDPSGQWNLETLFELRTKQPVEPAQYALVERAEDMPEWDIVRITFRRAFQSKGP